MVAVCNHLMFSAGSGFLCVGIREKIKIKKLKAFHQDAILSS